MQLTFEQQLNLLSRGVETVVFESNETTIAHYHFTGVSFNGLVSWDIREKRMREKLANNMTKRPTKKNVTKTPVRVAFDAEEGWDVDYDLNSCSVADTLLVEEVIRRQRKFKFEKRSQQSEDAKNPISFIENMDLEMIEDQENARMLKELAAHRNALIHALNGNIFKTVILVGDTYVSDGHSYVYTQEMIDSLLQKQIRNYTGQPSSDANFSVMISELDAKINKCRTLKYEEVSTESISASMKIRDQILVAIESGKNKKIRKQKADRKLLEKLLSTYVLCVDHRFHEAVFVPVMQSTEKEDTKRDNKTHKHDNSERSRILSNKGLDQYAFKRKLYEEYRLKQRIYKKQSKQEQKKIDKMIARLETQIASNDIADLQWKLPVDVRFGDFDDFLTKIKKILTDEVLEIYDWASIANCIYVVFSDSSWNAKWASCDCLRRALGLGFMSLSVFAGFVFHLAKYFGFIGCNTEDCRVQTFEPASTLAVIVTLVLAILYRKTPKAGAVEVIVNACKDLPLATRGIAMLETIVVKICNWVKGKENLEDSVPGLLQRIENTIMKYNCKEGIDKLITDEKAFIEVCQMRRDVVNISQILDTKSVYYQKFVTLRGYVNLMFQTAQRSPAAGCGRRKKPVVVQIWGKPGIGKSHIIPLISADTIGTILELEGYDENQIREESSGFDKFVYYRPVGVQYEQNFISSRAKIYVCDDANQVDAEHLKTGLPFPQAIIHLNNEHDHMLPVAELEMKAQALFRSALILATDNEAVPDLSYLQCPEAYHRRIDFSFEMTLKPQFSKIVKNSNVVDTSTLDLTKTNEHIYDFKSGGKVYTYDQVISLIKNELRSVHARFMMTSAMFKRRAINNVDKLKLDEEVPEYVANTFQNVERPNFIRRVAGGFRRKPPRTTDYDTIDFSCPPPMLRAQKTAEDVTYTRPPNDEEFARGETTGKKVPLFFTTEELPKFEVARTQAGFFERLTGFFEDKEEERKTDLGWWFRFRLFCVAHLLIYLPMSVSDRINAWVFSAHPEDKKRRRKVLVAATFLIGCFTVYKVYQKYKTYNRKSRKVRTMNQEEKPSNTRPNESNASETKAEDKGKEAVIEDEPNIIQKMTEFFSNLTNDDVKQEKYSDGPKSVKQKEKAPSNGKIKTVPLFACNTSKNKLEHVNIKDTVNEPVLELSCPSAYRTEKMVYQNMYIMILEFVRGGRYQYSMLRGFFLNDRCLITNRHFLSVTAEEYKTASISLFGTYKEFPRILTSEVSVVSFAHEGETDNLYYDLIAINFPKRVKSHINIMDDGNNLNFIKMEKMKDLLHQKLVMVSIVDSVEFEKINNIDTIVKNPEWVTVAEKQHIVVSSINEQPMQAMDPNGEYLFTWKTISYDAQTIPGSCGSVLISNSSNHAGKIVGIHMAGYVHTDESFGQLITAEMIETIQPICKLSFKPGSLQTILPNDFPIVDVISRPLFMPKETKLNTSICFEEIVKTTKAPAKLKYSKGEEHGAAIAIKKYLGPSLFLSDRDLKICKYYLSSYFKPRRQVKEVSREIAIRGIEGNQFIQAINRSSSAGYPLAMNTKKQGKKEFLGEDDNFIFDHPKVVALIDKIKEDVGNSERPEIYFSVTMKDELRKIEKPLARIFAAGPLQYTILVREKYIDYFAAMMEERIMNTSLIGINMLSGDVNVLVRKLCEVAHPNDKAFLAGDFKNFDGTLMTGLIWEIFEAIETFYNRSDKLAEALWLEITDSRQIFGNAVAHIASGQPSGNPGTTVVNTMYNSTILTLTISIILRENKSAEALEIMADLPKHFKVFTYGDDNIMSFSHSLRGILNPKLITEVMKRFGHTYTNDAKDGKELEFKTMHEISILKRTFAYDSIHGWIAPLDLISIMECLNWDKVSKKDMERKRAQTVVNMRVAIRELSLHPQIMFEKYRGEILTTAKRHRLDLPPECSFSQEDLRFLTLCGDNLFYFSDDFTAYADHRLRQGIYLELDDNEFNQFQDSWPRLECKQWSAQAQYSNNNQSAATSQQQITTYDQETSFIKETQPIQRNLTEDKFYQFEEIRDHTIKDVLSRVYDIADITVPTGGLSGDPIYSLNPFATFLNQTNVRAKLAAFAAIRANLVVRANVTTARTSSGALLFSYIPPLGTQRSSTLLQQSQSLRHDSPVSAGEEVDIMIPWVDAFLARSLSTNTGDLGTYRITRITPLSTDAVRIRIQIFCPESTMRVEYPTFMAQFTTREQLLKEKERLEYQIQQTMKGPQIDAHAPVARMQMNSLRNIVANIRRSAPKHSPSDAPLKAIKWQPGAGVLNDECETPLHVMTVNKNQQVETDNGQFGSGLDEMDVEHIMNTPNIIGVFPVTAAQAPGTVVYARPCTITDFIGSTTAGVTTMTISHQTFAASLAQQWSATLNFKIKGAHNQFHSFKLKSMFVPNDTGKYAVNQVMTLDDINAVKGEIHKFGADKMTGEHTIRPMLSTNMKNVPSPRNVAGVASLANYTANQYTQECSYGMFYIIIHTGMVLSSSVASTVYMYIDFHASDIILSEAETYLYLFPQTQMKGIEGESNVQARDETKSEVVATPETATTDEKEPSRLTTIKQSLGEDIHNLRQLTSAMTVFSNSFLNAATTAFMITPFVLRTTSAQVVADVGQYNDHIDYICSAYAFRKGGMIITIGRRSADNTPIGEIMLVNPRNNFSGTTLASARGIFTFTAPNSASSGSRVIPLYGEECMPRILIPYIQPFSLNRTANNNVDGFDNGSNQKYLIIRPYSTAVNLRFYRSAARDFRLGFLTSLPQYTLNVANVFV